MKLNLKAFAQQRKLKSKMKRQPSEWEKIIANETTERGLISKIYKQLITTQCQKNKQPNQKVAKTYTDISPKKTYRWLTNTWKDAQHCSLLEKCKSKLQCDITSHQSEWPSSKSLQTINSGEDVEKRESSYTVGGNAD